MDPKENNNNFINNSDVGYGYDYWDGTYSEPENDHEVSIEESNELSTEKENHPNG